MVDGDGEPRDRGGNGRVSGSHSVWLLQARTPSRVEGATHSQMRHWLALAGTGWHWFGPESHDAKQRGSGLAFPLPKMQLFVISFVSHPHPTHTNAGRAPHHGFQLWCTSCLAATHHLWLFLWRHIHTASAAAATATATATKQAGRLFLWPAPRHYLNRHRHGHRRTLWLIKPTSADWRPLFLCIPTTTTTATATATIHRPLWIYHTAAAAAARTDIEPLWCAETSNGRPLQCQSTCQASGQRWSLWLEYLWRLLLWRREHRSRQHTDPASSCHWLISLCAESACSRYSYSYHCG